MDLYRHANSEHRRASVDQSLFQIEEKGVAIQDMFQVFGQMVVVSAKRIFLVDWLKENGDLSWRKLYDVSDSESLGGYTITDVQYSRAFRCFYTLCKTEVSFSPGKILMFEVFESMINIRSITNVSREVRSFEMSCENQNTIFLIQKRAVFEFTLGRRTRLSKQFSCVNESINLSSRQSCQMVSDGDLFFTQTKKDLQFFKFDPQMRFFFISNDKVIKKFDRVSKELVQVFEGHCKKVVSVLFSEDFNLLFR